MMPTTLALARVLVLIPAELVSVKVEGVTFGASLHSRVTCSRKHGPALVTMHPDLLTALQLALQELTQ
jgi:hypothetical protein